MLPSEVLRTRLKASNVSLCRMSKDTGISETLLGRFVKGTRGLSLENFDKLCSALGLILVNRVRGDGVVS